MCSFMDWSTVDLNLAADAYLGTTATHLPPFVTLAPQDLHHPQTSLLVLTVLIIHIQIWWVTLRGVWTVLGIHFQTIIIRLV